MSRGSLIAVLLAATLALAGCGGSSEPAKPRTVTVLGPLTDVRFDQPTPEGGGAASLTAARNEYESFQVVVDAKRPMKRVNVVANGPLRGPGGAAIPLADLSIYREAPYSVGGSGPPLSDAESEAGQWPDALIPVRDQFYGERRNALPVDLERGAKVALWVDVFVSPQLPPGRYTGSLQVSAAARGRFARVPVSVQVRPFGLPSTASLDNSFGYEWTSVCKAHTGSETCNGDRELAWRLSSLYARSALDDRVTISNPFPLNHEEAPATGGERALFEHFALPLISGRPSQTRIPGAHLSAAAAYWPCVIGASQTPTGECLESWRDLAESDGFADRFFIYACGEPEDDEALWEECRETASQVADRWPAVPALMAGSLDAALEYGGVEDDETAGLRNFDTMAVLVNDMANRPDTENAGSQRSLYDPFLAGEYGSRPGVPKSLWLYASCQSYGCEGEMGDPAGFVGWPGYGIDQPPSQARAMGWLTFEYDASGELYYQTTALLPTAWTNSFNYGGNGDGTLFYPGLPEGGPGIPAIGGRQGIPIDSIRMKRIRDGREDYEYLHLLAAAGRHDEAEDVVESLFGPPDSAMWSATVSEDDLQSARARLAQLIDGG